MSFWEKISKPIVGLSPMDGVTDASFRFITAKHGGPDVTLTEFVNVETAFYAPQTLLNDLSYSEIERPIVAQIYGHTPEMFYKVAHIVCELGFDGIDINMGCPAKKVAAKGSGAALILNPELARSIIRTARRGIHDWVEGQTLSDLNMGDELIRQIGLANRRRSAFTTPRARGPIPVSVKTRIGHDDVVVEDWIRTLLQEAPSAISIHGRTLRQQYSGCADWEAIARAVEVAAHSPTLILGNGDLQSMHDVYRRVRETKVDGVLIGRAAQGNPWLFRARGRAKQAVRLNDPAVRESAVEPQERFRVLLEHSEHFAERCAPSAFVGMRKHLAWYCRSIPRAAALRGQMVKVNGHDDVVRRLRTYADSLAAEPRRNDFHLTSCDALEAV